MSSSGNCPPSYSCQPLSTGSRSGERRRVCRASLPQGKAGDRPPSDNLLWSGTYQKYLPWPIVSIGFWTIIGLGLCLEAHDSLHSIPVLGVSSLATWRSEVYGVSSQASISLDPLRRESYSDSAGGREWTVRRILGRSGWLGLSSECGRLAPHSNLADGSVVQGSDCTALLLKLHPTTPIPPDLATIRRTDGGAPSVQDGRLSCHLSATTIWRCLLSWSMICKRGLSPRQSECICLERVKGVRQDGRSRDDE